MSTQIAVRLPDEVVAFLDKAVPDSKATQPCRPGECRSGT